MDHGYGPREAVVQVGPVTEILYLAYNRREYTRTSFGSLVRNTNWELVERIVAYDDGSEDGTAEWLKEVGAKVPVSFELRQSSFRSPPLTMKDYVERSEAEAFVKIDNDVCVPPGWLDVLVRLAREHPKAELIGSEAGRGPRPEESPEYGLKPAKHIGGIGLMRRRAFVVRPPITVATRYKHRRDGFTIWQHRHRARAFWVVPDLAIVQLDRIPEEPWASLATEYVNNGWSRRWDKYPNDLRPWWAWLHEAEEAAA